MNHRFFATIIGIVFFLTACGGGGRTGTGAPSATQTNLFAYAIDNTNKIFVYKVDSQTGAPTLVSTVTTINLPSAIAVDPSNRFAYVTSMSSNNILSYAIGSDGSLSQVGSALPTGATPQSMTIDASGKFVYVANANNTNGSNFVSVYAIGSDGSLSQGTNFALTTPNNMQSMAIAANPKGSYIYEAVLDGQRMYSFSLNSTSGVLTDISATPPSTGTYPSSIAVSSSGKSVVVANASSASLSTYIVQSDGSLRSSSSSPFALASGVTPVSVALDPTGRYAYAVDVTGNTVLSFTFSDITASLATIGSAMATGASPTFVTVEPSGNFVYVANSNSGGLSVFLIGGNGALSQISGSPFDAGKSPAAIAFARK